jgi:hypothetical protein
MSGCRCGRADECDGEWAVYHPLQDGGMCAVRPCYEPKPARVDCGECRTQGCPEGKCRRAAIAQQRGSGEGGAA